LTLLFSWFRSKGRYPFIRLFASSSCNKKGRAVAAFLVCKKL